MAKLAWSVFFDGAWWPVANEAQLQGWVREGRVGPDTPARNKTTPNPTPLGQVPAFGYLFGVAPPPKKKGDGGTFVVGLIAFALITYWGRGSGSFAVLAIVVTIAAIIIVIAGKVVTSLPGPIKSLGARLVRRPSVFVFWCLVVGVGGLVGRSWHTSRVQGCTGAIQTFSSAKLAANTSDRAALQQLESLMSGIKTAREICASVGMTAEAEQLATKEQALSVNKPDLAVKAEEEGKREREANAVATFPTRSPEIKTKLSDAAKLASQQEWIQSDDALTAVQGILDGFKETSIEKNSQWVVLQKQLNAQRAQIKPQVDTIKNRGPMPEFVGGCCLRCLSYLKRVANDPDSIDCVSSTIPKIEGPNWTTTMVFRGKNGFGALVVNRKKFFLQDNQVVDMK